MTPFERTPKVEKLDDAYLKRVLSYCAKRGKAIYCCSEAYLLSRGFTYNDLDGLWAGVKPSPRKEHDVDYYFNELIADLEQAGLADAATFFKRYVEDGYPQRGYNAFLEDHGIPKEETFSMSSPPIRSDSTAAGSLPEQEHRIEEEPYAMNIFTNYDHVVRALIAMEGTDWFEHHQKNFGEYSIDGAKDEALKKDRFMRAVIYGRGGWNRYFIDKKGNVVFSESHGTKAAAEEARKNGFHVE